MTGEAEEIFGVEVSTLVGKTLQVEKVDAELATKRKVLQDIRNLEKTLPLKGREWLEYFRKLVNSDVNIIESLATDVSNLNTEQFRNINNNQGLRDLISNVNWNKIQTGLQNYTKLMQTFDLDKIVWNRNFMQNPFEYFFTTIGKENSEYLVIKKLRPAFSDAYKKVYKAKEAIVDIANALKKKLKNQYDISKILMADLRELDLFAVRNTQAKVERRVKTSIAKMEKLLKSVENFYKVPTYKKYFVSKTPWLDDLITQLENVDLAHKNLEIAIGVIYP